VPNSRRAPRAALLALLACLALALGVPAFAAAASYQVNTTTDLADEEPGAEGCNTEQDTCSLRAAIEEVNLSADATNTISFDPTVFNGQEVDTIFLTSPLQTILSPVTIDAKSTCTTAGVADSPCAGLVGLSGEPVLVVEENDVTIIGLSITSGSVGIGVFGESTGFTASGNWIGIPMSGTNAGNAAAGIVLGPGSDGAQIGGTAAADGNVIAHNEIGLEIKGASDATVQGNWFGRPQSGLDSEQAEVNIEITDYTASGEEDKAEDNEIGATVDAAAQATAQCDGGCNVISGAGETGIDLVGDGAGADEAPASGPTTIAGNYLGLDGAGTEVRPNSETGVKVGGADEVTIGAEELGDATAEGFAAANFFAGGEEGVSSQDGGFLEVIGNSFGIGGSGATVAAPSDVGIASSKSTMTDFAELALIAGNTLRMGEESIGIEHKNYGATIVENTIEGGEVGVRIDGTIWGGSTVEGNEITGPEDQGILITNKENGIYGNEVTGAGDAGIEVLASVASISGNAVGGDTTASENAIFDSGANAIIIRGDAESRNEVRRNHGSGNGGEGGFIVLRGDDPNGAEHPDILVAGKTEASGNEALPGAKVRVFRKASSDEGELAGFLGEGIADGSGNWKVTYAAVPAETLITATQTNTEGGTSGLSETVKTPGDPPAPPPPSGCPAVPSQCPPPPAPPAPDTTKPKVTIKKAPKAQTTATTAKFVFSSDEGGSKFKCKLDNKAFANCTSPKTYKKLKPGKHVFKVKATDAAGNVSAIVTRKFTVLE
jgi:CSLREA domain-containing protein